MRFGSGRQRFVPFFLRGSVRERNDEEVESITSLKVLLIFVFGIVSLIASVMNYLGKPNGGWGNYLMFIATILIFFIGWMMYRVENEGAGK